MSSIHNIYVVTRGYIDPETNRWAEEFSCAFTRVDKAYKYAGWMMVKNPREEYSVKERELVGDFDE